MLVEPPLKHDPLDSNLDSDLNSQPESPSAVAEEPQSELAPGESPREIDGAFHPLYQELKKLARVQLRKRPRGGTLCTTVLVHELYLRLSRQNAVLPEERTHFMALSARAMRQIVVDHARTRGAKKRGEAQPALPFDEGLHRQEIDIEGEAAFLLGLDRSLTRLEAEDPRLAQVAELRFFGGFSVAETAAVVAVSEPTVKRDSRLARAFLLRALEAET